METADHNCCDAAPDPFRTSRRIQDEASSLGFDWPDISGVFGKVREELQEVEDALQAGSLDDARRELGDVLFALVNLARFLDADPNAELQGANERFTRRFTRLREEIILEGLILEECTLAKLDQVWDRIKNEAGLA